MHSKPALLRRVFISQARIKEILKKNSYDVYGFEGLSNDPLTFAAYDSLLVKMLARVDFISAQERQESYHSILSSLTDLSASVWWLQEQPNAISIGIDNDSIGELHGLLLKQQYRIENTVIAPPELLVDLLMTFSYLRSQIAITKVIHKLRATMKTKGVIIMGERHDIEFDVILKNLSIPHKIYATGH